VGVDAVEVRRPADLDEVDALVLPGGESTTVGRLLRSSELLEPLGKRLADGMPALGTCAGMILLAGEILDGRPDQEPLDAIDITVRRNAFGRQIDSFETDLAVEGMPGGPFPAVFIRAPFVERTGPEVEVLAAVAGRDGEEHPVMCRQGPIVVAAFHPELSDDARVHELWLAGIDHDPGG
jgi:5'-phosphate synthase pdxT subunit